MSVQMWTWTVDGSPSGVAGALRELANRIEQEDAALVMLASTGFGEAWEAHLQVVVDVEEAR